ncbi:hypothetical protein BJV82DRAFT_596398 [Fennellomyces sp. T-0311]|nr:hypothetical protein BJV82DRAFT_596398 [Fennellomyces sp. T-0311]
MSNNSNGSDVESSSSFNSQRRKGVIDSRRAEQNRAAQRAFRQRKERYVKELETKVRDMQGLQERVDKLEEENERLRQRIWELEHRPTNATTSAPSTTTSAWTRPTSPSSPPRVAPIPQHTSRSPYRHHPYSPPTLPPPSSSIRTSVPLRLSDQRPKPYLHGDEQSAPQQQPPHLPGAEKGRVLDDLISILRSRHRPPIPAHLDSQSSSSPPSSAVDTCKIETSIH